MFISRVRPTKNFTNLLGLLAIVMICLGMPSFVVAQGSVFFDAPQSTTVANRMAELAKMDAVIKGLLELKKLEVVSQFYNEIPFADDQPVWQQNDYWATPQEFLAKNLGDCEDYAIAKYFSLVNAGVPETKLSLVYVQLLPDREAHMVLSYLGDGSRNPLILDNFINEILSIDSRSDLLPVYSFNGANMWIVGAGFSYTRVGSSERIKPWRQLKQKMAVSGGVSIAIR